jgi:hypothetical protein
MFRTLLVFLVIGASHSLVWAKTLELKHQNRTIFIKEFSNWELGKDLFGMPFIYFSPQKNGQRSNISFTDTGASLELDVKSLAENQKDYQKGRKEWAETVGASPLSFSPYKVTTNKLGHRVHQIGFSYQHEQKVYEETSYYIECRGKILFSKSLRLRENDEHDKNFRELIESIDCGGV